MKKGQKIKFTGVGCKEQINWGGNIDPSGILEKGQEYTVKNYEMRSWHTKLFLEEHEGQFNPLWFKLANTKKGYGKCIPDLIQGFYEENQNIIDQDFMSCPHCDNIIRDDYGWSVQICDHCNGNIWE